MSSRDLQGPISRNTPQRGQRGAVFVEFLIVFPPLMMLILGLVQTALVYTGHAVTQRSANAAVRAAVVILDDDPKYYGGAPRNSATGARAAAIKRAAAIPLSAISADTGTVHLGIGMGEARLQSNMAYALANSTVSSPQGKTFSKDADVTVRVAYDFPCGIPLGRIVVCGWDHKILLSTEATLPNQGASYDY